MLAAAAIATTSVAAVAIVRRLSSVEVPTPEAQGQETSPVPPRKKKKVQFNRHSPSLPATPKHRGAPGTDPKNGAHPRTVANAIEEGGTKHVKVTSLSPSERKKLVRKFDETEAMEGPPSRRLRARA